MMFCPSSKLSYRNLIFRSGGEQKCVSERTMGQEGGGGRYGHGVETPSGLVVSRACTVVSLQLPSLMGLDACPVFTLLYFARHAFDRADNVAPGQLW